MIRQAHPLEEEVLTLVCRVCGVDYLTDARDRDARLLHLPSGSHRIIPTDSEDMAEALRRARIEALSIAVRLDDLSRDMADVMALLDLAASR